MYKILIFLILLLVSCASPHSGGPGGLLISHSELRKGLAEHYPNIHLEDQKYYSVSPGDISLGSSHSWLPPFGQVMDCDDLANRLVNQVIENFYKKGSSYPPAIGTSEGYVLDGPLHAIVWYVDHTGKIRWFDPAKQTYLNRNQISGLNYASDK
jgi:hypothetical protein